MSILEEVFQEPFSFSQPLKADVMEATRSAFAASIAWAAYDLMYVIEDCASPIEQLFAANLWGTRARPMNTAFQLSGGCAVRLPTWDEKYAHFGEMIVTLQAPVGPYAADFLVAISASGKSARIAIECDGHDYHERTKQQAQHDKKRDRFFASQRLTVLRFTGSEITKDASKCVHEALTQLRQELHPKAGA